jgi:hypothetical protein
MRLTASLGAGVFILQMTYRMTESFRTVPAIAFLKECAFGTGRDQAALLTGARALRVSNWTRLR